MNLNINIYNNNIGVFVRKLYVYATELLITSSSDSEKLFGFQYIEYEKIFSSSNNLMPELVLAVPFDKITKSESVEGQYSIQYYMYDMTKVYNNRTGFFTSLYSSRTKLVIGKSSFHSSPFSSLISLDRANAKDKVLLSMSMSSSQRPMICPFLMQ